MALVGAAASRVVRDKTPETDRLAPRDGATLADAEALAASGDLAEAIAARCGATGEDFVTARRAVCRG